MVCPIMRYERAAYIAKNHTSPEKPSSTRPRSVFCPVRRASCPSVESQKLANISSTMPAMLCIMSVYENIHPAPTPKNIDSIVIVLGWTPSFFHIRANISPMGRVK